MPSVKLDRDKWHRRYMQRIKANKKARAKWLLAFSFIGGAILTAIIMMVVLSG